MNSPRHNTSGNRGPAKSTTSGDSPADKLSAMEKRAEEKVQATHTPTGKTYKPRDGGESRSAESGSAESGHDLADTAKAMRETVEGKAEEHKGAIAEMVADCTHALDAAADELAKRNQTQAADYVHAIGSAMGKFRQTLDRKSPGDMVGDVTSFAREHPAAFLGGGLLLGLALARVGKASADRERYRPHETGASSHASSDTPTTGSGTSTVVGATSAATSPVHRTPTHREDLP